MKLNLKSLALCTAMLSFSFAMNNNFADSNANQNGISKSSALSSYKSPEESIKNGLIDNIYYISVDMKLSQKYDSRNDYIIKNQYNYFIKLTYDTLAEISCNYDRRYSRFEDDEFKYIRFKFSWEDPSKKTRLNFTAKSGLLFDVCGYYEYYTPNSGHIYITNQNDICITELMRPFWVNHRSPILIINCLTEKSPFMVAMISEIKYNFRVLNDQILQNNPDFFKQNGIDRMKEFIKNQTKPNFFLSYFGDWSPCFGDDDCINVKNLYESFSNVGTQHIGPDLHEPKYPEFPINNDCFSSDLDELFPNLGVQPVENFPIPLYPNDDCFNKERHSISNYYCNSDESDSDNCNGKSLSNVGTQAIRQGLHGPKYQTFPINDDCFNSDSDELFPNVGTQHIEPDLHGPKYPTFPINDDSSSSDSDESDSDNWRNYADYEHEYIWPYGHYVVNVPRKKPHEEKILRGPLPVKTITQYDKRRIIETSFYDIIDTNNDIIDDENTLYLSNEEIINYAAIFGLDKLDNVYEITFSRGGSRSPYHVDCIKLDNENLDEYKDIYIDKNVNNYKLQLYYIPFFPINGTLQHFALEYKNLVFQGISCYFHSKILNEPFRVAMRAYNKENLRLFDLRFIYYASDRVSNSGFFSGIMHLKEEDNVKLEQILQDYQISEKDLISLLRSIINQTIPHDAELGSMDIENMKRSICTNKFNNLNNIYTIIERTTRSGYVKKFENIANNDEFKIDKLVCGLTDYNIDNNNIFSEHIDFYGEYKNFNIHGIVWYKNARDCHVNVSNELTLKLSFKIGNMNVFYFPYSENSGHIEVDTCKYMKISELISISQEILKRLKPSEYRDNCQDRNMIINGIIKLMINQRGLQNRNEICKNFDKNITEYDIEIS